MKVCCVNTKVAAVILSLSAAVVASTGREDLKEQRDLQIEITTGDGQKYDVSLPELFVVAEGVVENEANNRETEVAVGPELHLEEEDMETEIAMDPESLLEDTPSSDVNVTAPALSPFNNITAPAYPSSPTADASTWEAPIFVPTSADRPVTAPVTAPTGPISILSPSGPNWLSATSAPILTPTIPSSSILEPASPHGVPFSQPIAATPLFTPSVPYFVFTPSSPFWRPSWEKDPTSPRWNQQPVLFNGTDDFNSTDAPVMSPVSSNFTTMAPVVSESTPSAAPFVMAGRFEPGTTTAPVLMEDLSISHNSSNATDSWNITMAPAFAPLNDTAAPVVPFPVDTVLSCSDAYAGLEVVTFRYLLELSTGFDLFDLESGLNQYLAENLLPCYGDPASGEDIGILAFDSLPSDNPSTRTFCAARTAGADNCVIVDGQLRTLMGDDADADTVRFRVRSIVKEYLDSIPSVEGLVTSKYLSPPIFDPSSATTGASDGNHSTSRDDSVGTESVVLFTIAGVAFTFSVGVALWFRKRRSLDDFDRSEIKSPPALPQIDTMDTDSMGRGGPPSPFSEMLPYAYRLDGTPSSVNTQVEMSIILEMTNESYLDSSGVLISEGYTTDGSDMDLSAVMNGSHLSQAPVLGARRLNLDEHLVPPSQDSLLDI